MNVLNFEVKNKRFDDYIIYTPTIKTSSSHIITIILEFVRMLDYTEKKILCYFIDSILKEYKRIIATGDYRTEVQETIVDDIIKYASDLHLYNHWSYDNKNYFRYYACKEDNIDIISYIIKSIMYCHEDNMSTSDFISSMYKMLNSTINNDDLDVAVVYSATNLDTDVSWVIIDKIIYAFHNKIKKYLENADPENINNENRLWCLILSLIFNFIFMSSNTDNYFRWSALNISDVMETINLLMIKSSKTDISDTANYIFPVTGYDRSRGKWGTENMVNFLFIYGLYFSNRVDEKLLMKNHFTEIFLEQTLEFPESHIRNKRFRDSRLKYNDGYMYKLIKRCDNIKMLNDTIVNVRRSSMKERIAFLNDVVDKKRKITDSMVLTISRYFDDNNIMFPKYRTIDELEILKNNCKDVLIKTLNRVNLSTSVFVKLLNRLMMCWDVDIAWIVTNLAEKLNEQYRTKILELYLTRE